MVSYKNLSFFVLGFIIFMLPTSVAQAGVFSFLDNLFSSEQVETSIQRAVNSQTANILQAAININPTPSRGGGGIVVIDNNALLSDVGPLGFLSNKNEIHSIKNQISTYTVRAGDSLSQIAEMFDIDTNTIKWANDIGSRGIIKEGQTLAILPVSGVRHLVGEGDTINKIAKRFGVEADEILDFNKIKQDDTLAMGEVLIIPGGKIQTIRDRSPRTNKTRIHKTRPHYEGFFIWPVQGGVITQKMHGYNAVDIGAPIGTPIFASASGEVVISKFREGNPWFGGYGNYIVIKHNNGTKTLYSHNSKNLVSKGDWVVQGQTIALIGSTGRSTGPHLHFEVRGAVNPWN